MRMSVIEAVAVLILVAAILVSAVMIFVASALGALYVAAEVGRLLFG